MRQTISSVMVACAGCVFLSGISLAEENLVDSLVKGKPSADIRYRYEVVDQTGKTKNADAHTVRTRLGYETKPFWNLSARIDVENIKVIGLQKYNNTINGRTQYPTVADPDSTELDQGFLNFAGVPDTNLRFGRQVIKLDNQRYVGAVGFRQNRQTFDSFTLSNKSVPDTRLIYGFIFNINRIFGDKSRVGDFDSESHLINASYTGLSFGTVTGYGYLLDIRDSASLSSQSYGLRFSGGYKVNDNFRAIYSAEFARQTDYAANTSSFSENYLLVEPGLKFSGLTAKVGYEVLSGDGTDAFQTPLATGHAFNGIVDKFLTTPDDGLEDIYLKVGYSFGKVPFVDKVSLGAAFHEFEADQGGADYGSEWNAKVAVKINRMFDFSLQYADYRADTFSVDTQKFWGTVHFKY